MKEGRAQDKPFMVMYQHKATHRNWMPGPDHINDYDRDTVNEPDTLFYDYSGLASPAHVQKMEIANHMRWGWDLKLPTDPVSAEDAGG